MFVCPLGCLCACCCSCAISCCRFCSSCCSFSRCCLICIANCSWLMSCWFTVGWSGLNCCCGFEISTVILLPGICWRSACIVGLGAKDACSVTKSPMHGHENRLILTAIRLIDTLFVLPGFFALSRVAYIGLLGQVLLSLNDVPIGQRPLLLGNWLLQL